MKKRYEFLLFDIDGTLLDYRSAERNTLGNTIDHFGVAFDEGYHLPLYQEINNDIWHRFEQGLISGQQLRTERFQLFADRIGMKIDPEEMSRVYLGFLRQEATHIPGAMDVVRKVHGKFKLALITNGLRDVQYQRIDKAGLAEFFTTVVISEEVGIAKPDPAIFEHAMEVAGHRDRHSTLIIGDSLNSDIRGGIAFGIDTCWINPSGMQNHLGQSPTYTIQDIDQLPDIVLPS